MNKSDLARVISVTKNLPIQQAEQVVDTFFSTLADGLGEGRRVEIRGFGSFCVKDYDGYMGRNPKTGAAVSVNPKRLPFFKMGKDIKNALNK